MNFLNKVVLITGAGSGIGEATAREFAKLSANLALLDKNNETLQKVKVTCEGRNNRVVITVTDVSKDEEMNKAVDEIYEEYGKIDVLINCAGIPGSCGILDTNLLEVYDVVLNVNLRSVVAITHRVAPILVGNKGCIVNICSVLAGMVFDSAIPYTVAKAGVLHFTKCVALELASRGVRVNSVSPGFVRTNILASIGVSQEDRDEFYDKMTNNIPMKVIMKPEDIAAELI